MRSAARSTEAGSGPGRCTCQTRDAYVRELGAFVAVAAGRAEVQCTAEDALEALYIAEACEISRQENRPVTVDEVRA